MSSTEQKVEGFVEKKALVLKGSDRTYSRLKAVVHACGWKKRSEKNLEVIQRAFEEAGIYPEPMLTAPGLNWDEMIHFTREKPHPYNPDWYAPAHAFSSEKALQRFLIQNFDQIPAFSHLKHPQPEYRLPSGSKVDILCREKKSNDYVVIELKKEAGPDPAGQLEKYLVEVDKKRLAPAESPPRGCARDHHHWETELRPSSEIFPNRIQEFPVVWLVFRAQIEFFERVRVP